MTGREQPRRQFTASGLLTAIAGLALFAWLVWKIGPAEVWAGFRQVGWGLGWILLLGGFRFAARAFAWTRCVEPPHRLRWTDAFVAVVAGDAIGNLTPLGPIVGEPAKIAWVRQRVPVGAAVTALAIENVIYTLSVAAMLAAGTIALLFSVSLDSRLREFSEVTLGAIFAMFLGAAWILWTRPAVITGALRGPLGRAPMLATRVDKLHALEQQIYTFASRRRGVILPLIASEVVFHALGVLEAHITLWLILGGPPPLLTSFILESTNRLITVVFKFIPMQLGVGEAASGFFTNLLKLGYPAGVTLSLVRKARMGVWSLVGMALLVYHGLSARKILEDSAR
ncbi:MAG TPA: lysylphosphatidylglycerol synthase domain-containing protein [Vicinamibacterales bacterium]